MEEEENEVTVVTMRCIDMSAPHFDSWKSVCHVCGEMTWISASWKDKRIDRIVCEPCWFSKCKDRENVNVCVTERNLNEFLEWCKRHNKRSTREEAIKLMEWRTGKKIKIVKNSEEE